VRTISPTSSLFVAQRSSTFSQETWRNFGDTRGAVEKSGVLEQKSGLSLKRVKIEERLLWRTYRKSPTLFRVVPSATPYDLLFPRLGFTTPTKTPIAVISGTAKATHFKFSVHIHRVDQNKSASKQFGKNIHRRSQRVSKTFRALICKAHRAGIFAIPIAQLSCTVICPSFRDEFIPILVAKRLAENSVFKMPHFVSRTGNVKP